MATKSVQARESLARRLLRIKRDLTTPDLAPDSALATTLWQLAASLDYVAGLLRRPQVEAGAEASQRSSAEVEHHPDTQQTQQPEPEIHWWRPPSMENQAITTE